MGMDYNALGPGSIPKGPLGVETRQKKRLTTAEREREWRKEVRLRYGWKCGVPGCKEPGEHLHHIVYRSRSKALRFSVENTVPLCATHHDLEHGGKITIHPRTADGELLITGDRKYLEFKL